MIGSADDSSLTALGITAHARGVHRLTDGAPAARMVVLSGPVGSSLEAEDALRHVAEVTQQITDLDAYAVRFARDLSVPGHLPLLTVVDPASASGLDPRSDEVSVAVDPRDLARSPRRCLDAVTAARDAGRRVWVRVGVDDLAVAVLPVIDPDVVVLRPEVLAGAHDPSVARLVQEVTAHLENSTATVLADGVATEADIAIASSLGAHHGVGAAFDDHAPSSGVAPFPPPRRATGPIDRSMSPFAMIAASRRPRRGDASLLAEMGRSLEAQATGSGAAALVVRTVGRACDLTQLTARSWDGVQDETGMTPVYGVRVPLLATHHDGRHPDGPAWNVAVIGPHVAAMLAARPIVTSDGAGLFEFVQTYDRSTVIAAVRVLLRDVAR